MHRWHWFGWKVHGMVHGKWCMAFFYTPVSIRKAKRKPFLVLGFGSWTLEYLATQKVTHIVLPPNMDSSGFARHQAWQAGLSQMGAKTDTMYFCTNCISLLSINCLLAAVTGRPSLYKHHIPPVCCDAHRSLRNNTIYSSPLLWCSQVSLTI